MNNLLYFVKKAIRRMPNLMAGIIVFSGFVVLDYLAGPGGANFLSKEAHTFLANWKLGGYIFIILVYVSQQLWRDLPKPVTLKEVEEISPIMEQYLAALLEDYYVYLMENYEKIAPVRANIMLKVRRHFFEEPRLKIMYSLCCDEDQCDENIALVDIDEIPVTKACYSVEEREVLWGIGDGACGYAYKTGQIAFYDAHNKELKTLANRLTPQQQMVNNRIGSVVSVPIWLHGIIIGVLNIDSPRTMKETKFKDPYVHKILKGYASSIAIPCAIFADGVNPYSVT